jgi:hypothetical protein
MTNPNPVSTADARRPDKALRRRNLRTAMFLMLLVLAALASVFYEFGVFGKG